MVQEAVLEVLEWDRDEILEQGSTSMDIDLSNT